MNMSPKGMVHTTAVQIGPVCIGIRTNHPAHLPDLTARIEVKSLLTDFFRIEEIPFSRDLDGYLHIRESQSPPRIHQNKNLLQCRGSFLELAEKASDGRYTFWGNLGLLYRFTLYLLETCYGILNLHACALFSPRQNILYVVAGGAGSGKTVFLLSGIELGLQLFSTETVHIQIREENTTWHNIVCWGRT